MKTRSQRGLIRRFSQVDAALRDARNEGRVVRIETMARTAEVHTRTILRDLEFLRLFFDAPIEYDARQWGWRYARPWRLFAEGVKP